MAKPYLVRVHMTSDNLTTIITSVRSFPHDPGVYLMHDSDDTIIYVGKAKDLRKRVLSYFTSGRDLKTRVLVQNIARIEFIVTGNEYEALILENNLIKRWTPRFNLALKAGKTFPMIRITNEDYPRVFKTRYIVHDGSEYYGPFPDVHRLESYLDMVERLLPLRKCRGPLRMRYSPCLYYHIGRCKAPCVGYISKEEYGAIVDQVRDLLSGRTENLERYLRQEMEQAAKELKFERAAEVRDAIASLESITTNQQVQDFNQDKRDYAACVMRQHICSISMFQMREGKLIGRELYRAETFGDETEALVDFALQFYREADDLPEYLYVSHDADVGLLQEYFDQVLGKEITVLCPTDGKHYRILKMAHQNAMLDADRRLKDSENLPGLEDLRRALNLQVLPRRIEGFDIAQLSGKYPVASLISFLDGVPDKQNYRRFHIKTLGGAIDDYEAIREVIARRYTRMVNEKLEEPDLILIDGGTGQVNAAQEILDSLGLQRIPVIGLAKEFEEIHVSGRRDPIRLPQTSEGLKVLQAVRDETHRFATTFNKNLRSKDTRFTLLESVPGIGRERSKRLMQAFGSIEAIVAARPEELVSQTGVPLRVAKDLLRRLGLT